MKITFFGQLGLPQPSERDGSTAVNRVEALARQFALEGHRVTVFGTAPYLSSGNYHGVELKQFPSLDPTKPGGWIYLVFGLIFLFFHPAEVVHVHGWRAAFLLFLTTRFLFRNTRIVWTIDALPVSRMERIVLSPITSYLSPSITTSSRTLQYRLLVEYNVRAAYVPDGYAVPKVADISVARFGLKKNSYVVALVNSPHALRRVAKAYAASKTRKKLVVLQSPIGEYKRLQKKYPFIKLMGHEKSILVLAVNSRADRSRNQLETDYSLSGRTRRSIIANAAAVIIGDDEVSTAILLEAMHAKQAIIALNNSRYQEIMGVTGQYFAAQDRHGLASALMGVLTDAPRQTQWGRLAAKRAQRHFTWPRIIEDYHTLYAPAVRPVPMDSAYLVPILSTR